MISKIGRFITTDIWRIRLSTVSRKRSFFIKQLRIILLAIRGFDEDKCQLRASALTFYSLLSIVPMLAMAFGIAKGFGLEQALQKQLVGKLPGQEEIISRIIEFAHSLLENTKGGWVAGVGVFILFWTVIKVLGNIEKSFNDIWGIKKARSFGRKFSDYLSIMVICPILFIMSSSLTVVIISQIRLVIQKIALLGAFSPFILTALKVLPFAVFWILFPFVYIFMPNTKVKFTSGLLAGVIAGTVYQVVQWVYINFQVGVAKFNAIYGSFAALPLFLVWLQLSWIIVLFGAEISFAHQNVDTYEFEPDCLRVSPSFKRLLTLRIAHLTVKAFSQGERPPTASDISHTLEMPIRLVRQILFELVGAGILSEATDSEEKGPTYQPARTIDVYTIRYVIDRLEQHGIDTIPVKKSKELDAISHSLETFARALEKSPVNKRLVDI